MARQELHTIGFVGLGVMGNSMAGHLLAGGHSLIIYNRTPSRGANLVEQGAVRADSIEELARNSDMIITMVGYPSDVEQLYFGDRGIMQHARAGSVMIDMTTSKPALAIRIAEEAEKRGLQALDAPVSGGDIGARQARLSIMVGGDEATFERVKPLLSLMGNNIVRQGGAGAGQHTKMCNQIAIATNMIGVCESIAYMNQAGLDPASVLTSIESGAAGSWSLQNLAPRIIQGDYAPGFYIKHMLKDLEIALEAAAEMGFHPPGLELARSLYRDMANAGESESGTQALYKWYEKHA